MIFLCSNILWYVTIPIGCNFWHKSSIFHFAKLSNFKRCKPWSLSAFLYLKENKIYHVICKAHEGHQVGIFFFFIHNIRTRLINHQYKPCQWFYYIYYLLLFIIYYFQPLSYNNIDVMTTKMLLSQTNFTGVWVSPINLIS